MGKPFLSVSRCSLLASLLGLLVASPVLADSPETAPEELRGLIERIDAAANRQDLDGVLELYHDNFVSDDGLDRREFANALEDLWERFPNIQYRTEIQSWEADGDGFVAETHTVVTGSEQLVHREMMLEATLRSRQHYRDGQVISQDILSERSRLLSGENPPELSVRLPDTVEAGETFYFDAIVSEPLGDDLILGGTLESEIGDRRASDAEEMELEVLDTGGIFKQGQIDRENDKYRLSAAIVRNGGLIAITQRIEAKKQAR